MPGHGVRVPWSLPSVSPHQCFDDCALKAPTPISTSQTFTISFVYYLCRYFREFTTNLDLQLTGGYPGIEAVN